MGCRQVRAADALKTPFLPTGPRGDSASFPVPMPPEAEQDENEWPGLSERRANTDGPDRQEGGLLTDQAVAMQYVFKIKCFHTNGNVSQSCPAPGSPPPLHSVPCELFCVGT